MAYRQQRQPWPPPQPPPPMPRDYAYGPRAWNSGTWIAAASQVSIASSAAASNPPAAVPPVPLDYWSTELKENSLMLEGVKPNNPVEILREQHNVVQGLGSDSETTTDSDLQSGSAPDDVQHGASGDASVTSTTNANVNARWMPALHDTTPDRARTRGRNSHHEEDVQRLSASVSAAPPRASSQPPPPLRASPANQRSPAFARTQPQSQQQQQQQYVGVGIDFGYGPGRTQPSPSMAARDREQQQNEQTRSQSWSQSQTQNRRPTTPLVVNSQRDRDSDVARRHSDEVGRQVYGHSYGQSQAAATGVYSGTSWAPTSAGPNSNSASMGPAPPASSYRPGQPPQPTPQRHTQPSPAQHMRSASAVQRSQTMPVESSFARARSGPAAAAPLHVPSSPMNAMNKRRPTRRATAGTVDYGFAAPSAGAGLGAGAEYEDEYGRGGHRANGYAPYGSGSRDVRGGEEDDERRYALGAEDDVDEDDYVLPRSFDTRGRGILPIPPPIEKDSDNDKEREKARRIEEWRRKAVAGGTDTSSDATEDTSTLADRQRRPKSDGNEYTSYSYARNDADTGNATAYAYAQARARVAGPSGTGGVRVDNLGGNAPPAGMGMGMPITRHASAPAAPTAPIAAPSIVGPSLGLGMSNITEEPEEIRPHSRTRYRRVEHDSDYEYGNDNDYYGNEQGYGRLARSRSQSQSQSSGSVSAARRRRRQRERDWEEQHLEAPGAANAIGAGRTPHPAAQRQLASSNSITNAVGPDTLRVKADTRSPNAHPLLPSPRSLNSHSSRGKTRPRSFEQVYNYTAEDGGSGAKASASFASPTKHHGQVHPSPAHASAAQSYHTPPITPTRGDYIYRQDSGGGGATPGKRSPYTPSHQQQDATQHYAPGAALRPHVPASDAMARSPSRNHASAMGTVQTPSRSTPVAAAVPSYMYRTSSASPARPDSATTTPVRGSAANSPAYYDSPTTRSRGHAHNAHVPYTRTPSPLPPSQQQQQQQQYSHQKQRESARGAGAATPVRAHTPSRAHASTPSAPKLATPTPASRTGRDDRRDLERSASSRQRREHRSSSRASNHGAPAPAPSTRHVRVGFWNRRGDHLTFEAKSSNAGGSSKVDSVVTGSGGEQGYVVFCPPGRCYPPDLADYPEDEFKDHFGRNVKVRAGSLPELPESVPLPGSRHAVRGYDTFVKYALMPS